MEPVISISQEVCVRKKCLKDDIFVFFSFFKTFINTRFVPVVLAVLEHFVAQVGLKIRDLP